MRDRDSARVRANRANAQKSTGPKTAEGRARVSRNALSHGLSRAQRPAHDPEVMAALMEAIRADSPLADIDAEWVDPLVYRLADALLTLLKIRRLRNDCWRQLNEPDASQREDVTEPLAFVAQFLLTARDPQREKRDLLQNLKRLDRYELRAATRFRLASKALADLIAAHAPRPQTGTQHDD